MVEKTLQFWIYLMARDIADISRSLQNSVAGTVIVGGTVDERGFLSVSIPVKELPKDPSKLLLLVSNKDFSREKVDYFLSSPSNRNFFIEQLLKYLMSSPFSGVNLDLEMVSPEKRENLNALLSDLNKVLEAEGFLLSISVPAKTRENFNDRWNGAFDYRFIGEVCDYVMIMTYDFHWPGGPAGFISPISWVRDVIDFAILQIPPEKILLGLPAYGYDWLEEKGKRAKGLSYSQVKRLLKEYKAIPIWDEEEMENHFTYTDKDGLHHVYYHDRRSLKARMELAEGYQLGGVILWRKNLEDFSIWEMVK